MATASTGQAALRLQQAPAYDPNDFYIAVMGVTGAGKSTFISKCCGNAEQGVGHSLKSETKDVQVFSFIHNGKRIHLIDTPGFDDTYRTDSDVLQDLAYWLTTSYKDLKIKLTGIIYLHRITDPRMTGNALKNLRTFQKLCGKKSMSSVVLVTTMWEQVDLADGNIREADLSSTAEFWGDMLREHASMMRHLNNHLSAMNIILHLVQRHTTTVLELQTEMVDLKRPLDETEAGREVEGELLKQMRLFEQRLQRAQDDMKEAMANDDKKHMEEIAQDQERLQKMIKDSEKGREDLRINLENLIKEKELQHQQDKAAFDAKLKTQADELKQKDEEFKAWQKQKEKEEQQREQKRRATEAELRAAQEQIELGDELNLAVLLAAVQKCQDTQEAARRAEEQMKREFKEKERLLSQERMRLEQLERRKAREAAYQQARQYEQAAYQQVVWRNQQYEQAAWNRHQYQYQYQYQYPHQQPAPYQYSGGQMMASAGLGMATATAMMNPFCNVM